MGNLIDLSEAELLGTGRDRLCYRHPLLPQYCIKVSKKAQKQTDREHQYYLYMSKKKKDTSVLTHYISYVKTTEGPGAIYEAALNEDGTVAPTLTQVLSEGRIENQLIKDKLNALKAHLLEECICVRDIRPNNIMCLQQGDDYRFVIVDGIGNVSVNPLNIWFPSFTRKIIEKAWIKLEKKINLPN